MAELRLPSERARLWARPVGWFLDHVLYRTGRDGRGNVPKDGPVIFAANHLSYLDGPVMYGAAPRTMHILVKQEMFAGPLGPVLKHSGQIPVDRSGDRAALQACKALLDAGRCVGILPEGTRGRGDASSVNNGVAWLALQSGAPVVPVAILGTRRIGEHKDRIPGLRRRLHVSFGEPITVTRRPGESGRASMDRAAERIRAALAGHVHDASERTGIELPDEKTSPLAGDEKTEPAARTAPRGSASASEGVPEGETA